MSTDNIESKEEEAMLQKLLQKRKGFCSPERTIIDFRSSGKKYQKINTTEEGRKQLYCSLRCYIDQHNIKDIECHGHNRDVYLVNLKLVEQQKAPLTST
jgi:hypothetical protein